MKVEGLGVLHWVNYQGDDLEHSYREETKSQSINACMPE